MIQINFSNANNSLPHYADFIHSARQENKMISDLLKESSYQFSTADSLNNYAASNISWEYFSNELEFE